MRRILTTATGQLLPRLVHRLSGKWAWGVLVLAAWLLAAPTEAQAQAEQYVDLKYDVDSTMEGCLSAVEFQNVVARRLGYDPHRAGSEPSVVVHVQAAENGIEGSIEWIATAERRIGERRFSSPGGDCHDMTVTMAFVVAVQVQLMATEPGAEQQPEPANTETAPDTAPRGGAAPTEEPSEANTSGPSTPEPPERLPAARSTTWWANVGAGPAVGFGLGPRAVGLGRVFLAVRSRWVGAELGGEATLPSTTHVEDGTGFRHDLIVATLATCGSMRSISACGVAKVGRIRVKGTGVDEPATPRGLVGQVGARFAYALRLDDRFSFQGHVDGLYLMTPWTIDLNQTPAWTTPRFSAVAGIALASRFP